MEQGGDRAARVPMIRKSSYERCPLRSVSLPGTNRTDLDCSNADRTDRYDDLVEPQVVGAQMISLIV
jgi:hypothetical protein